MKTSPIVAPLPQEHLTAIWPTPRPDSAGETIERLHFWSGRALTADALELEQRTRAGRLACLGQLASAGVVYGLEVALEAPSPAPAELAVKNHFLHILPGYGVTATGEDVLVTRALRIELSDLQLLDNKAWDSKTPAVILVRPVELRSFAKNKDTDPCELDLSRDAFADERRLEAAVIRLCRLPKEVLTDELLSQTNDVRWRNRLATALLEAEIAGTPRQHAKRDESTADKKRPWQLERVEETRPAWESEGVPIGLLGVEPIPGGGGKRFFLDRASVVRIGSLPHPRSKPGLQLAVPDVMTAGAGTPAMWRARVDQFAEHLAVFADQPPADQAKNFQFLPPVGLLPRAALSFLTTEQARALVAPNQTADRADVSSFFPANFAVEAVPVAAEDLDAALAASASLAPYDLLTKNEELVRLLVPLPQHVFDSHLLVVDRTDPAFGVETNRLAAVRQDWRQRSDHVAGQLRVTLANTRGSNNPDLVTLSPRDADEKEKYDREYDFKKAFCSPREGGELRVSLAVKPAASTEDFFFVRLLLDAEFPPTHIEVGFTESGKEYVFSWTAEKFPAFSGMTASDSPSPAYALWQEWLVSMADVDFPGGENISEFRIKVDGGRVAVAGARIRSAGMADRDLWSLNDEKNVLMAQGGEWSPLTERLGAAPFEDNYTPVLPDGVTLEKRVEELDLAAQPAEAIDRKDWKVGADALTVKVNGLEQVLATLAAEADEADDFVDAHFTRAQTNLYRVRKFVLGEAAAQELLINPAIATIAEQKTALASAEKLRDYLTEAKKKNLGEEGMNAVRKALKLTDLVHGVAPAAAEGPPGPGAAPLGQILFRPQKPTSTLGGPVITIGTKPVAPLIDKIVTEDFRAKAGAPISEVIRDKFAKTGLADIVGDKSEAGPTLPPRGLSIGRRFKEPPAADNLGYARTALQEVVDQLPRLRLALVGEEISGLKRAEKPEDVKKVNLLDLQARAKKEGKTAAQLREDALKALYEVDVPESIDEAEVTLAALDLVEIKTALLRGIERCVQERRQIIQRGQEIMVALQAAAAAAQNRLALIEAKLAEARHDLAVARALWQEEEARAKRVNDGRDRLLAEEVKFLAYVRPRALDLARRDLRFWRLESTDTPRPVPACLQRHDEPPEDLASYIQLFRHAPVGWFPEIAGQLHQFDTHDKIQRLLTVTRETAVRATGMQIKETIRSTNAPAVLATLQSSLGLVLAQRQLAVNVLAQTQVKGWLDLRRDAETHSSLGDVIDGQHGQTKIARTAAAFLEQIEQVATCLHAEFAGVPPATRLRWVERYSQFDTPAPLRDLTALPGYGSLPRDQRRRFQAFVTWLFERVNAAESGAVSLINDLIRLCLLLASHAPVNRIISGHVPRPAPVRPGVLIPIRPLQPPLVRAGMIFQITKDAAIVARGRVEDLHGDEVTARVEQTHITTVDASMRVQFMPAALVAGKLFK